MNKILKTIEWYVDYYLTYFLYNPRKKNRYVDYMTHKYGPGFHQGPNPQ